MVFQGFRHNFFRIVAAVSACFVNMRCQGKAICACTNMVDLFSVYGISLERNPGKYKKQRSTRLDFAFGFTDESYLNKAMARGWLLGD